MDFRVGTSGFSYKEWKGPFYPEDLPAKGMLAYYADRLPAVEINNTFYRLPKPAVLEGWCEQVPDDFRFVIKASRRITHFGRLKESAYDPTAYLLETLESLGDRLGLILFQLPPNMKQDLPRLEAFLEQLPDGTRAAFEFRHESWFDDATYALLEGRQLAVVTVDAAEDASGEGEGEPTTTPVVRTAPYGYFRLRRPGYEAVALAEWADSIATAGLDEAFVFFKHEDAGAGPKLAGEFLELAQRTAVRRQPRRVRRTAASEDREAG